MDSVRAVGYVAEFLRDTAPLVTPSPPFGLLPCTKHCDKFRFILPSSVHADERTPCPGQHGLT